MHSGYFEAILQLRDPSERAMTLIATFLERKNLQVAKEVPLKDGVDLYLSDQHVAQRLGQQLKELGASVTISKRIFSRDKATSKDLYRVTILARFPHFQSGDAITVGDRIIKVSSIGKRLLGTDLENGKRVSLPVEGERLEPQETRVIAIRPTLTVMDPESYQPAEAVAQRQMEVGEKVKVVLHAGRYFCL